MNPEITKLLAKTEYDMEDLLLVMQILRSEDGCPWDREQTHESIRNNLIEETYEVVEAIDEKNVRMQKEELGDLLLQIVFHSQIAREEGKYRFGEITDGIVKKLIVRHPHIFASAKADNASEVLSNWEKIKIEEKGFESDADYIKSVPKSLPALMRAQKTAKRMIKKNKGSLFGNNTDDTRRFCADILKNNNLDMLKIGTLLFYVCALCDSLGFDAEEALCRFNEKIILGLE